LKKFRILFGDNCISLQSVETGDIVSPERVLDEGKIVCESETVEVAGGFGKTHLYNFYRTKQFFLIIDD
jgi:hypothetical protein